LDEDDTERDVPHFYVDIEDIKELFAGWTFLAQPREWCDYKIDGLNVYRRHWTLLVRLGET